MDDADTLDGDGAVGRDGLRDTLLRGAPDVHVHVVARAQPVVLRRGYLHGTFEGQVLVVEDVVTEYLALRLLFLVVEVLQRVGHHEVHGIVHLHEVLVLLVVGVALYLVLLLRVLHAELRGALLVLLLLLLALLAVGLTHALLGVLGARRDVLGAQGTVLHLLLVFLLQTAYLLDGYTTLHQLCHNLLARHAAGVLLHHEVHHLIVCHARLAPCHRTAQQQADE